MRRILLTVAATTAMLAVAPGLALAHRHHRHHHRSHHAARVHHRRAHHRIRHRRFGRGWSQSSDSQGPAGTVTSFTDGVLTITLNDGSTVSGNVTSSTEIECTAPGSSTNNEDGDNGGGDNSGEDQGDDNASAGNDQGEAGEDQGVQEDQGQEQGEDQGQNEQMCDSSSLTPGTPVAEAELKISSAGATWEKVELVTS